MIGATGQIRPKYSGTGPNMNLALVSQQLNQEMMTVFLTRTSFLSRHATQFGEFIGAIRWRLRKAVPYTDLDRLCFVELQMDLPDILMVVNCSIQRVDSEYHFNEQHRLRNDPFKKMCSKKPALRKLRLTFTYIGQRRDYLRRAFPNLCQKTLCLAVWAGARSSLRHVSCVELEGHINNIQKQEWLEELALERKGILPDEDDLVEWKHRIWHEWYVFRRARRRRYAWMSWLR